MHCRAVITHSLHNLNNFEGGGVLHLKSVTAFEVTVAGTVYVSSSSGARMPS